MSESESQRAAREALARAVASGVRSVRSVRAPASGGTTPTAAVPAGWTVRTQCNHASKSIYRPRPDRWAYVITAPHPEPDYVSPYRYFTAERAQAAGEADARGSAEAERICRNMDLLGYAGPEV